MTTQRTARTRYLLLALLVALLVGRSAPMTETGTDDHNAYVEASLLSRAEGTASVVVTASDIDTARRSVERIGGQVTSELWLIDAVAATIPVDRTSLLAAQAGVVSIVDNKSVQSAQEPECDPDQVYIDGPCALYQSGWVTNRREKKGEYDLPEALKTPIAALPDGGFVALSDKETVIMLNSDGSVRLQVTVPYEKVRAAPVVGPDGSIYFVGEELGSSEDTIVVALDSDGSVRWTVDSSKLAPIGLAVDFEREYVYAALAGKAKLWVLDIHTGSKLIELEPSADKPGLVTVPPTVGADGTVYLQTSGLQPDKDDLRGNLLALDPAMFFVDKKAYSWRFVAVQDGSGFALDHPAIWTQDTIYLASEHDKKVVGLNPANGTLKFVFDSANKIEVSPTTGPDGALYLPAEKSLRALEANGSVRFEVYAENDAKFATPPIFSPDGATAYLAAGSTLYALNTADGAVQWQARATGNIATLPTLDSEGNVIVGSDGEDLIIVAPDGRATTRLRLNDKLRQTVNLAEPDAAGLLVQAGDKNLVTLANLPEQWDGRPDVEPAEIKREWKLSNAVADRRGRRCAARGFYAR